MPDIMLMLLQAGAQHTQPNGEVGPGSERGNAFKLLLKWRLQHDYSYGETAAKHLIDYGAWVKPVSNRGLFIAYPLDSSHFLCASPAQCS